MSDAPAGFRYRCRACGDRVAIEGFASLAVDPAGARAALREPPLLHALTGTAERPVVVRVPEPGRVAP